MTYRERYILSGVEYPLYLKCDCGLWNYRLNEDRGAAHTYPLPPVLGPHHPPLQSLQPPWTLYCALWEGWRQFTQKIPGFAWLLSSPWGGRVYPVLTPPSPSAPPPNLPLLGIANKSAVPKSWRIPDTLEVYPTSPYLPSYETSGRSNRSNTSSWPHGRNIVWIWEGGGVEQVYWCL